MYMQFFFKKMHACNAGGGGTTVQNWGELKWLICCPNIRDLFWKFYI